MAKRARGELGRLRRVRNIIQLSNFLGMTLAEIAEYIPPQRGKREHITASTLDGYGKRRPDGEMRLPNRDQLDEISRLVARKLTARYGVTIGAWAEMNSPLRISPRKVCFNHKEPYVFEIRRHTDKCRRCNR